MHTRMISLVISALCAVPRTVAAQTPTTVPEPTTVTQAVDKLVAQEQAEVQMLHQYAPLAETYIQLLRPDKQAGAVLNGDRYFLGRAELVKGVELEPLVNGTGRHKFLSSIGRFFGSEFLPLGFLQMIYLDQDGFDKQHYKFTYVGREFLGEVRCLTFDVDPLKDAGKGRFAGRIWVEDQDYHIVRFNGSYGGSSYYFNFDSWRVNSGKNRWLPAFIYSEQGNLQNGAPNRVLFPVFKAQTRLWGYDLNRAQSEEALSSITVEAPSVKDQTGTGNGYSPLQARRAWGRLAEDNVAAKMQAIGWMAPYGDVDKLLETVVNNLEVTNELDIQPNVRCRVLMTSTMESFTMGHTIVMSRGLIDVLPDENSLAAILAHELGHVTLGHRMDTQFAFFNRLRFDEKDTFHHFGFSRNAEEEEAANKKGGELLKKSPYQDPSGAAQAFFQALQGRVKQIPNLISPHLRDIVPKSWATAQMMSEGQNVEKTNANARVALPLGGRIKIEPMNDQLTMLKPEHEGGAVAEYEKMPFEVSPFLVYLTRAGGSAPPNAPKAMSVKTENIPDSSQPKP